MDIGSFFNNSWQGVKNFFGGNDNPGLRVTVPIGTPATSVPIPARKPAVPISTPVTPPVVKSGFDLNSIGSFLDKAAGVVEKGVTSFYSLKSAKEQLATAQELEKLKYEAITASAKNAPAPAQIVLPTFADWLNNPREAASMVTPAALAGSGFVQSGLSSAAYILGGAVLIWAIAKKA